MDGSIGTGTSLVGTYKTRNGFDVANSEITLENCAATRCPDAGFAFNNSKVIVSRGLVAFRNYEILANTPGGNTNGTSKGVARNKNGAGIRSINSDITVSSNHNITSILGTAEASGNDFILWSSRNAVGLDLINSKIHGGDRRMVDLDADTAAGWDLSAPTTVSVSYNNESGLRATNSEVALDGRLDSYNNEVGIELNDSHMLVDELTVENSKSTGLEAKNSNIIYNKNSVRTDALSGTKFFTTLPGKGDRLTQITFNKNAQNIKLNNSILDYKKDNDVYTKFGIFKSTKQHGVKNQNSFDFRRTTLPNIELTNNSKANLLNPRIEVDATINANIVRPLLGGGISVGESGFKSDHGREPCEL